MVGEGGKGFCRAVGYEITVCQAGVGGGGRPISAPDMKSEVSKQDLVFFFQTKSFFSFPMLCQGTLLLGDSAAFLPCREC